MICYNCKKSCMGSCKEFGSFKTDTQVRNEKFGCFQPRFYNINKTNRYFEVQDNIYLDEMNKSEIKEALAFCNRIKSLGCGK